MFSSSLNWFRRLIVLGAVVAGATAATAGAVVDARDGGSPIAVQGSTALGVKADGMRLQGIAQVYKSLSNDSFPTAQGLKAEGQRLTGIAQVYRQLQPVAVPDVFERYAAAHPNGAGTLAASPGTERIVDDWFRDPPTVVASPATGNGLDWGDFGIGAGAMLGLALLLTGLGVGAITVRHRAGKLGTS